MHILRAGKSQGLPTNIGRGAGGYDRNHPNGYMQNYSADFQYEFGRFTVLEVGYAGRQGRKSMTTSFRASCFRSGRRWMRE